MPPLPKPRAQRARTNRKAGASILSLAPTSLEDVPAQHHDLPPERRWHPATLAWWADVVRSPMASEWIEVDWHALRRVALLVEAVERAAEEDPPNLKAILSGMAEIRLQGALYGLATIDRTRLHWELDKGDKAKADRAQRSRPQAVAAPRRDPRVAK